MATRASFFVFAFAAAALAAAAACSSSSDQGGSSTCDVETTCYLVDDAGFCGASKPSGPCEPCPAGYSDKCTERPSDDAGPSNEGGVCQVEVTCYELTDSGACGAQFNSGACQPCPAGSVEESKCPQAEDAGTKDGATSDAASDSGKD
jgi:hypothetical protein